MTRDWLFTPQTEGDFIDLDWVEEEIITMETWDTLKESLRTLSEEFANYRITEEKRLHDVAVWGERKRLHLPAPVTPPGSFAWLESMLKAQEKPP